MQGLHIRRADLFSIPLAVFAGSIALLWIVERIGDDGGTLLCFGVPFVLMVCYIAFGRSVMAAITHRQTYYGLTDRRILIISGLLVREVTQLDLNTITEVTLQQPFGETGTILFSVDGQSGRLPRDSSWLSTNLHRPPRFEQLADAEHVVWLIRQAQRG